MPTRIITVSELKVKLGTLMAELETQGVPLYVTQHGKPKAVLARYDEYETLLKKIEDLEDILTMKDSLSTPEDEAVTLEDYEHKRATYISD
jgi:prevent-host-death family protein